VPAVAWDQSCDSAISQILIELLPVRLNSSNGRSSSAQIFRNANVVGADGYGIDGESHECHPQRLGGLCEMCRRGLPGRLAIVPVVHDAADALLDREPEIRLE